MNDQTLFATSAPTSARGPSSFPTTASAGARAMLLDVGVASTLALLLSLSLFLAGRRWGGAFDQPLSSAAMLALGLGMAMLASFIRLTWPRFGGGTSSVWARRLLPTLAVWLFCYALSLPGSASWAVALLWFLVVVEEGAWWLADWRSDQERQQQAAANSTETQLTNDWAAEPLLETGVEGIAEAEDGEADVTQQITRIRDAAGGELIFGQARAEFSPGLRTQIIHLAFCPPLAGIPEIQVMQGSGPPATINVAQAEPFGTRFEVRLASTARQPEQVMVEFEARHARTEVPNAQGRVGTSGTST